MARGCIPVASVICGIVLTHTHKHKHACYTVLLSVHVVLYIAVLPEFLGKHHHGYVVYAHCYVLLILVMVINFIVASHEPSMSSTFRPRRSVQLVYKTEQNRKHSPK